MAAAVAAALRAVEPPALGGAGGAEVALSARVGVVHTEVRVVPALPVALSGVVGAKVKTVPTPASSGDTLRRSAYRTRRGQEPEGKEMKTVTEVPAGSGAGAEQALGKAEAAEGGSGVRLRIVSFLIGMDLQRVGNQDPDGGRRKCPFSQVSERPRPVVRGQLIDR